MSGGILERGLEGSLKSEQPIRIMKMKEEIGRMYWMNGIQGLLGGRCDLDRPLRVISDA